MICVKFDEKNLRLIGYNPLLFLSTTVDRIPLEKLQYFCGGGIGMVVDQTRDTNRIQLVNSPDLMQGKLYNRSCLSLCHKSC